LTPANMPVFSAWDSTSARTVSTVDRSRLTPPA
jgi:hypothetical protein